MNTHDIDIELPEHDCLYETTNESGFIDVEPAYRKSTVLRLIEADRKRRGEPVMYQVRTRPAWSEYWFRWEECTRGQAEGYRRNPIVHDWHYEVRELYTAPQSAEPSMGEPVPKGWKLVPETPTSKQIVHMACQIKGADADGWFRTDGGDWPEHVDAAERAYKCALSEAPQPAVPSGDSLPRHVAQTLADAIYKAAQKIGIANGDHSTLSVPQCLHLLECMSQPAEPVKVPSDDEIEELWQQVHQGIPWMSIRKFARALLARYGSTTGEATKQQQKIEQSMHRGARLTDHRFKL